MRLGIMCGIQCSGKSTEAKKMMEEGWIVLNPDTFRQVYSKSERTLLDSHSEKKVWFSIGLTAESLLRYGHDKILIDETFFNKDKRILIDGTFVNENRRKFWTDMAKRFNIELEIYVMPFDVELSLKRNRKISRFKDTYGTTTDNVILKTAKNYSRPTEKEGKIIEVEI
jgi:predicted kinase